MLATIQFRTHVFSSAVEKLKKQNMQYYNFVHGSMWVRNLVSDIEEHRLRVFKDMALRRIFGPKRMKWVETA
jgi:hypothetical protein